MRSGVPTLDEDVISQSYCDGFACWLGPILAYCRVDLADDYSDHESFCGNALLQRAPDH